MKKFFNKQKINKILAFSAVVILVLFSILFFRKSDIKIFDTKGITILNFGDVMFDRGIRNIMENKKRDPFEYIKKDINIIRGYDIKIVNLEGPIVKMDRSLCQQKIYNFQFGLDTTDRLKSIGINMVNIANNHIYDCYNQGVVSTRKYLEEAGIDYMGDLDINKSFVIKEIKGKKVAFVGMDETVQMIPLSKFYPLVKKLKAENDYVVVNIHWGTEYELKETNTQKQIAHRLVDSGADVIFGHHPHVYEPLEVYKGSVVFYSLGNFVFDQDFGNTTVGLGAGVEFKDDKKVFEIFPYNMKKFAPDFMKDKEREEFCFKYLEKIKTKKQDCTFEI